MRDRVLLVGTPEALAAGYGSLAAGGTRALAGAGTLLWLRPDQWLLCLDDAPDRAQLSRPGVAVLEAGARFVEFVVAGPSAVARLAGGCGLDFRPRAFAPGTCAQSRIDPVPVILHREALDRFTLYVERPLARYFAQWLAEAAIAAGQGESP